MNAVLVTRCNCRKTIQIEGVEAPPGIVVEMDHMPEGWPEPNRRFSFIGNHQVHQYPMYLEDLPERTDGEVINGVFVIPEIETNEPE